MMPTHAKLITELRPDQLAAGQSYRFWLELVRDALGQPVSVPVLVLKGRRPGPTMGVISTLHGNEVNGIRVIHELINKTDPHHLRGTIIAVVVANTPSFLRHQRVYIDGRDLNHLMPGQANGNESQIYAYRLVHSLLHHFDYLLDLHTASFGRINSFYIRADMKQAHSASMAYLLRPQIILHNPPSDGTLRGVASEMGIPSITVEIGNPQVFQPELIKQSLVGIRAIMGEFGMLTKRPIAPKAEPLLCIGSQWLYTSTGGLLQIYPNVRDHIEKGECIARIHNIFGDTIEDVLAPSSGLVIGKSTNPVGASGARILHYGTPGHLADFFDRNQISSLKFTRGAST